MSLCPAEAPGRLGHLDLEPGWRARHLEWGGGPVVLAELHCQEVSTRDSSVPSVELPYIRAEMSSHRGPRWPSQLGLEAVGREENRVAWERGKGPGKWGQVESRGKGSRRAG